MSMSSGKACWSLAVGILVMAIFASSAGATCPGTTVITVPAGSSDDAVRTLLYNNQGSGTVFCFQPTTSATTIYRFARPISPYLGQILMSDPSGTAVLDGSVRITNSFTRDPDDTYESPQRWKATLDLPLLTTITVPGPAPCQTTNNDSEHGGGDRRCWYNESVFVTDSSGNITMPRRGLPNGVPNAVLPAGTYAEAYGNPFGTQGVIYLSPDFTPNATGTTVDLAVASSIISYAPNLGDNVTVKNFIIQKAANPSETGAINAYGSLNWTISGNEVRYNHGVGIGVDRAWRVGGPNRFTLNNQGNITALNDSNYIHHNGQSGLEGSCVPMGGTAPLFTDPTTCIPYGWDGQSPLQNLPNPSETVENNIFKYNNWLNFSTLFGAGGSKFAGVYYLIVRYNVFQFNNGPATWCDINCFGATFDHNDAEDNDQPKSAPDVGDGSGGGIVYEVSRKATITNNTLRRNEDQNLTHGLDGFNSGGILIAESSNVTVGGSGQANTIVGYNGIGLVMVTRRDWCGGGGPPSTPAPTSYDWPATNEPYCVGGIHDIRDADGMNRSQITYNDITELALDSSSHGEIAGLDTSTPHTTTYFPAQTVYDNNAYHFCGSRDGLYFAGPCNTETCTLLSRTDWRSLAAPYAPQDPHSLFNFAVCQ